MEAERIGALIKRLEKASGPDREIDAEIWFALYKPEYRFPDPVLNRVPADWGEAFERMHWDGGGGYRVTQPLPHYTSSLDAALALCERVLPGDAYGVRGGNSVWGNHHRWSGKLVCEAEIVVRESENADDWDAFDTALNEPDDVSTFTTKHCSPALALCLALLRALSQKESSNA